MCDETISEYLQRTHDPDPRKRKKALKDLCPCHVRADIPQLWDRIFEMLSDEEGKTDVPSHVRCATNENPSPIKPYTCTDLDNLTVNYTPVEVGLARLVIRACMYIHSKSF